MKFFQLYSKTDCVVRLSADWKRDTYSPISCPRCGVMLQSSFGRPIDVTIGAAEFREDYPRRDGPFGVVVGVYECHMILMTKELAAILQAHGLNAALGEVHLGGSLVRDYTSPNAAAESRIQIYPNRLIRPDTTCDGCGRTLHSSDGNAGYHMLLDDVQDRDVLVSTVSCRVVVSRRLLDSVPESIRQDILPKAIEVRNTQEHRAVWDGVE